MKNRYSFWLPLCGFFCALTATAQQPSVYYQTFITGLSSPVEVVNAGDGTNRLFIVQQNGIIRVYDPAATPAGLQPTPFLDATAVVRSGGEQGLLSMAFHPAFEINGYFFIYYNNNVTNPNNASTPGDITVARYYAAPGSNTADATSGVVLLNIPKPETNHNGGHLQFAADGTLYFATGDGGGANDPPNNAQNPLSLLGKMLRLNVNNFTTPPYYTVPANNPFVGNAAYDSRIWALGLRNPYRWSFDRLTGDMWIGDVGQGAKEEVNYRPGTSTGGENYGWRCYEGTVSTPVVPDCTPPNNVFPVFEYDNLTGSGTPASVVGGYVYRGTEYPSLQGYYVSADVYSGNVYLLKSNGAGGFNSWTVTGLPNLVVGFGEAENGTLYAVRQSPGTVYKVVPSGILPVSLQTFTGVRNGSVNHLRWTTASERNVSRFVVEYSPDGRGYAAAGEVTAANSPVGSSYSFTHAGAAGMAYYRLKISEPNGTFNRSAVIKLGDKRGSFNLYPTVVRDGRFTVNSGEAVNEVQVINANGKMVYRKVFNASAGLMTVNLPATAKGLYVVRVIGTETRTEKIVVE